MTMKITILTLLALDAASAWTSAPFLPRSCSARATCTTSLDAAVGIFYGTSTGSTQEVADLIYEALGSDLAAEPEDVETLDDVAAAFAAHDALIVGTPTWNTGADSERSGTGWDELYYDKMPAMQSVLKNKKVAVFGLGDQESYAENYADATGELFDVFESLGCLMLGSWSQEGYEHEDSKSIRGDKFCGLLLDAVNQEELSEERVEQWVVQLKSEGFLESGGAAASVAAPVADVIDVAPVEETAPAVVNGDASAVLKDMLEGSSTILDENIESHSSAGFAPHFNPKTAKTMWTSQDGRQAYVTAKPLVKTDMSP